MRENRRVNSRGPHPRLPILAVIVLGLLLGGAPAAASPAGAGVRPLAEGEGKPTITKPASQRSIISAAVSFKGSGTEMVSIKAEGLPEGLKAKVVSLTEWTVTGTPTKITPATTVKVTVENASGKEKAETAFEWTVDGLNNPGAQTVIVGAAVKLPVSGVGLSELTAAKALPEGLSLEKVSEAEWRIVGTPAKPGVGEVELVAHNSAKEALPPVKFSFTVDGLNNPGAQTVIVGAAVKLPVSGVGLSELTAARALPEGLSLEKVSEAEWRIVGTPALPGAYTVQLEGADAKQEALPPVEFALDVGGFQEPGAQLGTVGTEMTVFIAGSGLFNVTAGGLPPGLELLDHEGAEIEIAGTPSTAGEFEVELNGEDEAEQPLAPVKFKITILAAPVPAPTATGQLSVSPAAVFSAARSSCGGVGFSAATVSTQWLLDGAPIAGATAATYVPPRVDDGHMLSCRETATSANGAATLLTSPGALVHEQPPQPAWPIGPAAEHCATALCMEGGNSAETPASRTYERGGSWLSASQVRCVSAPWTSIAGNSTLASVEGFAEAHAVSVTLQRVTATGVVNLASEQLGALGAPADALDGSVAGSPFAGQVAGAYGAEPFTAGELWAHVERGSLGKPDRFAAGQGYIAYQLAGAPGVRRSFQLLYNLTAADLGARLRCVVSAEDGPAGAATSATLTSPEYAVAKSASCGPRTVTHIGGPQPAVVLIGSRRCLGAQAGLGEIGGSLHYVSSVAGRSAFALECELPAGCTGRLGLSSAGQVLASAQVSLHHGARRVLSLDLDAQGRSRLRRDASRGLPASLTLTSRAGIRLLLAAKLLNVG